MDFSELKPTERVVDILHPKTGEETGIKIMLVSLEDDRTKRARRKIQDERLRLEARGKGFKSDDLEENSMLLLHAAITGWEWAGDALWKGEKPTFNLKMVKEILTELPWLRSQIERALEDESAFF